MCALNQLLEYAGKNKRQSVLFAKENMMKLMVKSMGNVFMVDNQFQNLYLQTRPQIATLCESAAKGTLSAQLYPGCSTFDPKQPAGQLIVFIVGGATYCEAKELSQQGVVLGSTHMLNSESFLKQLQLMSDVRRETVLQFEME